MRKQTEDWGDYKTLPEEIPEFLLFGRMLLGADSVVHTPRLKAFQTNERRMAKFSESMDPCFVCRSPAVLQFTQFANADDSTRRRMSNAGTPKSVRFEEEWAKLDLSTTATEGKAYLREAALIVMNARPELAITGKLLIRTAVASIDCAEVVIELRERETGQQVS